MSETRAPVLRHLAVGTGDCFDGVRCVIKRREIYFYPVGLVLGMRKSQCVPNDLKRNTLLWIFLREEVLV